MTALILLAGATLSGVMSCHKGHNPKPPVNNPPLLGCRISQYAVDQSSVFNGITTVRKERIDYQYDQTGNKALETDITKDTSSDGTTKNDKILIAYAYDKDKYLVSSDYNETFVAGSETQTQAIHDTYSYVNGKISVHASNSKLLDGTTHQVSENYTWNSVGQLVSDTKTDNGLVTAMSYEYTSGKVSKVTRTANGQVSYPVFETDGQGHFTRMIIDGYDERYQYDQEGQIIHSETWAPGIIPAGEDFQYDNKTTALSDRFYWSHPEAFPLFYPTVGGAILPVRIHNLLKTTLYKTDINGKLAFNGRADRVTTYTTTGYPAKVEQNTYDKSMASTGAFIETYTYTNCN